jgi:hypothetical protein
MAFASYLVRARPDSVRLEPRFAVIALSTPASRALIEAKAATTAGQYNLNLAALWSLPVPLPPIVRRTRPTSPRRFFWSPSRPSGAGPKR